jgi:hypothetical protein
MSQPHDILGLIITVYDTPAQPIARRAATLLYIFPLSASQPIVGLYSQPFSGL